MMVMGPYLNTVVNASCWSVRRMESILKLNSTLRNNKVCLLMEFRVKRKNEVRQSTVSASSGSNHGSSLLHHGCYSNETDGETQADCLIVRFMLVLLEGSASRIRNDCLSGCFNALLNAFAG